MPDYTKHYAETERRLRELLAEVADKLPARTMADAWDLLAAREYGLCLETIAADLKKADRDASKLIHALADSMEMTV
jgi:hypothetical protein